MLLIVVLASVGGGGVGDRMVCRCGGGFNSEGGGIATLRDFPQR